MRIKEALNGAVKQFQQHAISETPLLEASLLLSFVTNLTREQLYTHYEEELDPHQIASFHKALSFRLDHTPIAYIIGKKEFYAREFLVTPDVLIPRGDTEVLVETALSILEKIDGEKSVLDLCTGSGCIGITIALEHKEAKVTLSDISSKALHVAHINSISLDSPITEFVESNLFDAFDGRLFTLIVSNPPYIAPSWYRELSKDVLHEPSLALLDESEDGLSLIKSIISISKGHLHKEGSLVIECDYRQIEAVMKEFTFQGFNEVTYYTDLGNKRRLVSGRYACTKS